MSNNNFEYAIVSGEIVRYVEGSVKIASSEFDKSVPLIHYIDDHGIVCVTKADNFYTDDLCELERIIKSKREDMNKKVAEALAEYPQATDTEKKIIEYLVKDGYELFSYEDIQSVTINVLNYMECNATLHDAYMDYMH